MRIGHASISENGTTKGNAGDQTGKEVCIREWYNKPWKFLLRAKSAHIAELMATACEKGCGNPCIGYDQSQRNTLHQQAALVGFDLSRIKTDCECDCSSFMTVCAECAGLNIQYNGTNAPTTSTMKTAFLNTGAFTLITDPAHLTKTELLKRGDILVTPGAHTVMVLDDGTASKYQYGMDVSSIQGVIDFEKAITDGISFVCIRSTKKNGQQDEYFKRNLAECQRLRIDYSCYKYSYALTEQQAIDEARSVIKLLGNTKMMIWLDLEDKTQAALGKKGIEKVAMAFIKECNLAGFNVGIYCSENWFKNYIPDILKQNYMFWVARYGKNDGTLNEAYRPSAKCYAWQYTSKGKVSGVNGVVDLDVII